MLLDRRLLLYWKKTNKYSNTSFADCKSMTVVYLRVAAVTFPSEFYFLAFFRALLCARYVMEE